MKVIRVLSLTFFLIGIFSSSEYIITKLPTSTRAHEYRLVLLSALLCEPICVPRHATLKPRSCSKESYLIVLRQSSLYLVVNYYYLSFYINNLYYVIHCLSTIYKVLGIAPKLYFYTKLSYYVIKSTTS